MELQIAYPSQLLLCLLQRTMFITGVVTRVSSPNGMVSIPLEAPPSWQGNGENKTFHYGKRIPSAIPKLLRSYACVNRHPDRPVSPPFSSLVLALFWRHHQTERRRCRFCPAALKRASIRNNPHEAQRKVP